MSTNRKVDYEFTAHPHCGSYEIGDIIGSDGGHPMEVVSIDYKTSRISCSYTVSNEAYLEDAMIQDLTAGYDADTYAHDGTGYIEYRPGGHDTTIRIPDVSGIDIGSSYYSTGPNSHSIVVWKNRETGELGLKYVTCNHNYERRELFSSHYHVCTKCKHERNN